MRPVVYWVAATMDGYTAEADGSFAGFPMDEGYLATPLMGRNTYEVGLAWGSPPLPDARPIRVFPSMTGSPHAYVTLVRDSVVDAVASLKRETGTESGCPVARGLLLRCSPRGWWPRSC